MGRLGELIWAYWQTADHREVTTGTIRDPSSTAGKNNDASKTNRPSNRLSGTRTWPYHFVFHHWQNRTRRAVLSRQRRPLTAAAHLPQHSRRRLAVGAGVRQGYEDLGRALSPARNTVICRRGIDSDLTFSTAGRKHAAISCVHVHPGNLRNHLRESLAVGLGHLRKRGKRRGSAGLQQDRRGDARRRHAGRTDRQGAHSLSTSEMDDLLRRDVDRWCGCAGAADSSTLSHQHRNEQRRRAKKQIRFSGSAVE